MDVKTFYQLLVTQVNIVFLSENSKNIEVLSLSALIENLWVSQKIIDVE